MIKRSQKKDCCGCGACAQRCPASCITMAEDHEGFLYPMIDHSLCTNCTICESVCPVIHQEEKRVPLYVYAAKNPQEAIRMQSSSGGIFTLLAEGVINEKGIVFGARFNAHWEVIHDYTETAEELTHFRGSKYVQSKMGNAFRQAEIFLKQGRKVLFSGTPCQIAGLKRFLGRPYEHLLTIDIVCHGVPSPEIWRMYLHEISAGKQIEQVSFRDKSAGWKNYHVSISYGASEYKEPQSANLYMKGFLNNLYLRPSCYVCPSKCLKSGSDITLGDYWGIHHVLPDFDDDKGVGLTIINTKEGKISYEKTTAEYKSTDYAKALNGNSSLEHSPLYPTQRDTFFQDISTSSLRKRLKKYTRISLTTKIKRSIHRSIQFIVPQTKQIY